MENWIIRILISSKSKSESSERKWADLDEPYIETTSVFPEVCCFQEVESWSYRSKGSVLQIFLGDSWQDYCSSSCWDSWQNFWRGWTKLAIMSMRVASLAHFKKTIAEIFVDFWLTDLLKLFGETERWSSLEWACWRVGRFEPPGSF